MGYGLNFFKLIMKKVNMLLIISIFLFSIQTGSGIQIENTSESWMGIYLNGIKVGYSHSKEKIIKKEGKKLIEAFNQARMKVSRFGGNPVEIISSQESLYNLEKKPLEVLLKSRMSEIETVIKAEITPERVIFKLAGEVVKELLYDKEFYLEVPLERIIRCGDFKPGNILNYKILDPIAYSFSDCRVEILGKEEILILGERLKLWHLKSELKSIIPIEVEEWSNEDGDIYKSITRSGFLNTVSIRMSQEKAQEPSGKNFDIAFSSIIKSNVLFDNPQKVRKMKFNLSGVSAERIKGFPWDDGSQKLIKAEGDSFLIGTYSRIFNEKEACAFPVKNEEQQAALKPTVFCQADAPEIVEEANTIIGTERNSWRAAKEIAEWVAKNMTPNYDIGFASAKEIFNNRKGDCSEYTVLFISLCRAVGIPARASVGIMYGGGLFAYHMWPEVYVGEWVSLDAKWLAVDKDSGEYYTDATHLKFGHSNLDENMFKEMITSISEIIGKLKIEILDYSER